MRQRVMKVDSHALRHSQGLISQTDTLIHAECEENPSGSVSRGTSMIGGLVLLCSSEVAQ